MTTTAPVALPDFRNLGVVLRVALLTEALRLLAVLLQAGTAAAAWGLFVNQGVLVEPVLLSALAALAAIAPWLQRLAYGRAVALALLLVGGLTLGWHWAVQAMGMAPGAAGWRSAMWAVFTAGVVAFYFNWRHYRLSPAWGQARLMALQARMRPHFLYNSLNSVLALVRVDPARAEAMLQDLAEVYRALLADPRMLVPFEQELALAQAYVQVESIRFGERLRVRWRCERVPPGVLVPSLMLQPLLENAVQHGVEPQVQGADVDVEAWVAGNLLTVRVRNSVLEQGVVGAQANQGNGMALANLAERLELHYDAEARLKTDARPGEFVVSLHLPVGQEAVPGGQ